MCVSGRPPFTPVDNSPALFPGSSLTLPAVVLSCLAIYWHQHRKKRRWLVPNRNSYLRCRIVLGNLRKDHWSFGFGAAFEADISLIACIWIQKQRLFLPDYTSLTLLFQVMVMIMIIPDSTFQHCHFMPERSSEDCTFQEIVIVIFLVYLFGHHLLTFMSFQTCTTLRRKILVHSMKVSGVQCCFGPHWLSYGQNSWSKLCSTKEVSHKSL